MGSSFILDERAICTLWPAPLPTSLNGPFQRTVSLRFAVAHGSLSYPSSSAGSRHDTEKAYSLREAVCRGLVCLLCRPVLSAATPSVSVRDSVRGGSSVLCPAVWWRGRRCVGYPMTVPFSVADDESVILTRQYSPARTVRCEPSGRVVVRSKTTILFCDVRPHICSRERLL